VTFHPSVPLTTPYSVLKSERGLMKWEVPALEFNFPVEAGQKVEVRLYFAEIYWDSANARVFDVLIEDDLVIDDYDIYAEVGHDVGVMKSFEVTSDGNLDIDLRRVKQQPKISGIEIIAINDATIAGIFGKKENSSHSNIYPNPFTDKFTMETISGEVSDIRLFDYSGRELQSFNMTEAGNEYVIDISAEPKGLYFLQYRTKDNLLEMKKIIKR